MMRNTKLILVLAMTAAILMIAVGGTIAYLIDATDPIQNTFNPAKLTTEIEEEFDYSVKKNITIKNTSDVPAYVRVTLAGNWVKDGNIVAPWSLPTNVANSVNAGWIVFDNCYYYRYIVPARGTTPPLFTENITAEVREDGATLKLDVIHQSVQAVPKSAATEAWGSAIDNLLQDTVAPNSTVTE